MDDLQGVGMDSLFCGKATAVATEHPTREDGFVTFAPAGSKLRCRCGRVRIEQGSTGALHFIVRIRLQYKKSNTGWCWTFCGGGGRIRTIEAIRSRFTVCPLWPLGNSPIFTYRLGAGRRTRTPDLLITNQLLYQLSYTGGSNRTCLL